MLCVQSGVQAMLHPPPLWDDSTPPSFDTQTSCYAQVEGAWNVDGRGPSIWDTFSHTPGKVANNENGNTADDFYHKWQQDVEMMKTLGLQMFRFSLSWSRIMPQGRGEVSSLSPWTS